MGVPTESRTAVEGDLDFGGFRAFNPHAPVVNVDVMRLQDVAVGAGLLKSSALYGALSIALAGTDYQAPMAAADGTVIFPTPTTVKVGVLPNKFIAQGTADAQLGGAQFLGALGTGLVKNTVTTGVLSIAMAGVDYQAAFSLTSGSLLVSGGGAIVTEDNANAYFDVTNHRLILRGGGYSPAVGAPLTISGSNAGSTIVLNETTNSYIDKSNGDLILRVVNANSLHVFTSGNNDRWFWDLNGSVTAHPGAVVGGATGLSFYPGAHTAVPAENIDLFFAANTVTFAAGATIATQRSILFQSPTYAAASARTITTAATFSIGGAPTQGPNITITNAYSLWVMSGKVRLEDQLGVASTVTLDTLAGGTAVLVKASTTGALSRAVLTTDYPSPAATYWVASSASIPTSGVNLGALTSGLVKIAVVAGVATPSTATVTTDYPSPLSTYWVASSANIPTNGVNLGALSTGIVKITVAAGVATPADAVAGTDYLLPFSLTSGSVVFSGGGSVLSQNNNNFFWDATNARLVLGNGSAFTPAAGAPLTVNGGSSTNIAIQLSQASTNQYILKSGGGLLRVGTTTADALELHTNNTARVAIDANGNLFLVGSGVSGSSTVFFESRAPANSAVAGELFAYWFRADATVQFAAGATIGLQRTFVFQPATYSAASARTITTAATLAISGAPSAGTNMSITQPLAFWISSGDARINGNTIVDTLGGGTSEIVKASTTGVLQRATAGTDYMTVLSLTAGSVLFSGGGGVISQDNVNNYYDATNHRLHLGKGSTPTLAAGSPLTLYNANTTTDVSVATALGLLLNNSSASGQTLIGFSFAAGAPISGMRWDFAGNLSFHVTGSQGVNFYGATSATTPYGSLGSTGLTLNGLGTGTAEMVKTSAGGLLQRATINVDYPGPNAFFWVGSSISGPGPNQMNLGALTSGLVKITVAGGTATPSTAVAGTDYMTAVSLTAGSMVVSGGGGTLAQDNSNAYYDVTNHRLHLGKGGTPTLAAGAPLTLYTANSASVDVSAGPWALRTDNSSTTGQTLLGFGFGGSAPVVGLRFAYDGSLSVHGGGGGVIFYNSVTSGSINASIASTGITVTNLGGTGSELVKTSAAGLLSRAVAGTDYLTAVSLTAGSVVVSGGAGAFTQDNANNYFDVTNHRLHLGKGSTPTLAAGAPLTVWTANTTSDVSVAAAIATRFENSSATGQTLVSFAFGGTAPALGLRADYAGNLSLHIPGTQGVSFYAMVAGGTLNAQVNASGLTLPATAAQAVAKSGGALTVGTTDANSLKLSTSNVVRATWDLNGSLVVAGASVVAGGVTSVTVNAPAHTAVRDEVIDVYLNLARAITLTGGGTGTAGAGQIATLRSVVITPPTYNALATQTVARGSTFCVTGPPVIGTNMVFSQISALEVSSGFTTLCGPVFIGPGGYVGPNAGIALHVELQIATQSQTLVIENQGVSGLSVTHPGGGTNGLTRFSMTGNGVALTSSFAITVSQLAYDSMLLDTTGALNLTAASGGSSFIATDAAANSTITFSHAATSIARIRVGSGQTLSLGSSAGDIATLDATNGLKVVAKRFHLAVGAAVASAGTITLGTDGNYIPITGSAAISFITTTNVQAGFIATLQVPNGVSFVHGAGGTSQLFLPQGGFTVSATNGFMFLQFQWSGTSWNLLGKL